MDRLINGVPTRVNTWCVVCFYIKTIGRYIDVKEDGTFTCVVCGNKLFKTDKKFESGSGWPSFSDVANSSNSVIQVVDKSHGMVRRQLEYYVDQGRCTQLFMLTGANRGCLWTV